MTDSSALRRGISIGALAFGVAGTLTPRTLVETYGAKDPSPEHLHITRLWASSTAALGTIGLMTDAVDDKSLFQVAATLNAVSALLGFTASGMSPRARLMSGATSAVFAAAAAYGLQEG